LAAVFSLAAVVTLFVASCSSLSPDSIDAGGCVNKIAGDEVKAQLEEIVDRFTKHNPGPQSTVLIRESCHKQIYRRGTDRIVIYNLAGTRGAAYYAGVFQFVVHGYAEPDHGDLTPAEASKCLARARSDLVAIGTGADTLDAYRKKFGDVADDPDIGAVHYLNCSDVGELSYQRSLDAMVHELTHQNTENNCL
jgi:hypothetical protein